MEQVINLQRNTNFGLVMPIGYSKAFFVAKRVVINYYNKCIT